MLRIELQEKHFNSLMFITNGKQFVRTREFMPYLERFFSEEDINIIKCNGSELLYFSKIS